jgi:ADP-heptose:LPS heptosyltransferase
MDTSNPKHPLPNPMNLNRGFLIVRTDRLGDVVLTLPMARAIKKAMPNARVTFLASEYTRPIIERCPDVDEIRTIDPSASFWKLVREFCGFGVAFFPSPRFRLALAGFLARVPMHVGTGYRWYSFLFSDRIYEHRKTAERHEAEYNLRMLAPIGISSDADELPTITLHSPEQAFIQHWLAEHLGSSDAKFTVLHITSGGSTNPWPAEQFIELGRSMTERYGIKIVLTGVTQDADRIRAVAKSIGSEHAVIFIGNSLLELAALLERAAIVITNSTGPGHLSAALGTPTIGLFPLILPLNKERWGFRGTQVINLSPNAITGCPNCKNCTCMERIPTESVLSAVETMLDRKRPSKN